MVGEVVRQQTIGKVAGEGPQDRGGLLRSAGGERQARQADHRVAAPVVEPVVAGDDAAPVRVVRQRPGDEELVGGEHELLHDRVRILDAAGVRERSLPLLRGGQGGSGVKVGPASVE